jgi:hypothetical protein
MATRLVLAVLFLASTAVARTHHYDLETSCGQTWTAVREVLLHSGKYGVLFMQQKDLTASYNIGGSLTGRRTNTVQLIPNGKGCTMNVQTAFSGVFNKDAGDFSRRVKEALANVPASAEVPSDAPQPAAEEGSREAGAPPPAGATLKITSQPPGAEIELDGNFSGQTPSSVGVHAGEHTLKLTKAGYMPWEHKVTTTTGTVTIAAELKAAGTSEAQ